MKSVALHNLGCKVNAYELEVMQQNLQDRGYKISAFDSDADIYIVNTCTVTTLQTEEPSDAAPAKHKIRTRLSLRSGVCTGGEENRMTTALIWRVETSIKRYRGDSGGVFGGAYCRRQRRDRHRRRAGI